MTAKRLYAMLALALAVVAAAIPAHAAPTAIPTLQGKVVEVKDAEVRLSVVGNEMPQPGDEVTLSFRIPGGPAVKHGTWRVTRVEGDDVIAQKVQATGVPAPGHDATIVSPRPVPRQARAAAAPAGAPEFPQHHSYWIIRFEGREYRTRYETQTPAGTPIDLYYYRIDPGPGAPAGSGEAWARFVRVPSVRHSDQSSVEWWHGAWVWRDGAWKDEARRGLAVEVRRAD